MNPAIALGREPGAGSIDAIRKLIGGVPRWWVSFCSFRQPAGDDDGKVGREQHRFPTVQELPL